MGSSHYERVHRGFKETYSFSKGQHGKVFDVQQQAGGNYILVRLEALKRTKPRQANRALTCQESFEDALKVLFRPKSLKVVIFLTPSSRNASVKEFRPASVLMMIAGAKRFPNRALCVR